MGLWLWQRSYQNSEGEGEFVVINTQKAPVACYVHVIVHWRPKDIPSSFSSTLLWVISVVTRKDWFTHLLWSLQTMVFQPFLLEWTKEKNTAVCSSRLGVVSTRMPKGPKIPLLAAPEVLQAAFWASSSGGMGSWVRFGLRNCTSISSCIKKWNEQSNEVHEITREFQKYGLEYSVKWIVNYHGHVLLSLPNNASL